MTLYRVRTAWTGGPGGGLLSTHYFESLGGTAAAANTAVGALWTALASTISNTLTARTEAAVFLIDENTGQPTGIDAVTPITVAGGSAADPLPYTSQAVIQWRTGTFIGGRELRGRTFVPGMTEGNNTAGVPIAGFQTTVNAAAAALIADANSAFCIYSPTNATFDTVVTGQCWSQWGVLRSRRL